MVINNYMNQKRLFWYSINLIFGIFGFHFFITNKTQLALIQLTLGLCSMVILFNTFILKIDVPVVVGYGWTIILLSNLSLLLVSVTMPLSSYE